MPFLQDHPRFSSIKLPPSGWVLAILLSVYICTGLIGHDPWKHDDAITIGLVYDIYTNGNWLTPQLAGQPYPDAPLYYWVAATAAHLFSWILPLHDASRLASGIFTLLALEFILLAARELHGKEHSAVAPLALAGSIGFLYHAHEAQPMLAALCAQAAAYWALALLPRRPGFATPVLGAALAASFLSNGLLPVLALLPAIALSLWQSDNKPRLIAHLAAALLVACALSAFWLLPLWLTAPKYLLSFFASESSTLLAATNPIANILRQLNLLTWYAWPALPLAAWALWSKRRLLNSRPMAWPGLSFVAVLLILGVGVDIRSAPALLLLPPLVLIAAPGVASLRRGAANAFDWFAMMTFTFFAGFAWIAWSALTFGWPERLARQALRLHPGFTGSFDPFAAAFALACTLAWLWLIATTPRSPMRSLMHWMAGLTLFWLLVAMLWMPWIDYGKSYRPVAGALSSAIPARAATGKPDQGRCIANGNLPNSILATFDYYNGIRTLPLNSDEGKRCNWLLVLGEVRNPEGITAAGWRKTWEGKRPGDRRESDKFHLYRRDRARPTADLPELPPTDTRETAIPAPRP